MVNELQMEEMSVKALADKYNFIVPEIQREYVWGKNENHILDLFFKDLQEKFSGLEKLTNESFEILRNTISPKLNKDYDKEILIAIEKELERFKISRSMNIGFLYSYKPNYYIYNDSSEDVYLIDGQQRFTTLFIALFYFAVLEEKVDYFKSIFRIEILTEKLGFDYRVRTITHNFLVDILKHTIDHHDLENIENKTWFLSDYRRDASISALIGTFSKLREHFPDNKEGYFDFLLNHINFWHFKTEETSQGEELYITMNSRGKALSDNEILRAKLFEKLPKNKVKDIGKYWEKWQDFFWRKKGDNENSDLGFNEFLRWVQILIMVNQKTIDTENEDEQGKDKKVIIDVIKWEKDDLKLDAEILSIEEIGAYFKAVEYLFDNFCTKNLENVYTEYLNKEMLADNWLCPIEKNVLGQNECFRLLPVLQYLKLRLTTETVIDDNELYRVVRYFYNLIQIDSVNKSPNVASINAVKTITELVKDSTDIADIIALKKVSKTLLSEEERFKFNLYKSYPDRCMIEQEFWDAEDHKLNSGRIGHLIQASFETKGSIENFIYENDFKKVKELNFNLLEFISVKNKFFTLNSDKTLKTISNKLWGYLIPTSYYKIFDYGTYRIIKCDPKDNDVLISKEFLKMVLDINLNESREKFFVKKAQDIFAGYSSLNKIVDEDDLKVQLFTYFILLYDKKSWDWNKGKNFGCYDKTNVLDFHSLFKTKIHFQHYDQKWGGADWRYVKLNSLLDNIEYLKKLEDSTYWINPINSQQ